MLPSLEANNFQPVLRIPQRGLFYWYIMDETQGTQAKDEEFTYHRPISARVVAVGPIPHVRELPQQTELRINLTMDGKSAIEMIMEILTQFSKNPKHIGIEVKVITG